MRDPDIGDFLGRKCVLDEHGAGEITTWLSLSSQVFSLLLNKRAPLAITDRLSAEVRGDIGGFGAGSWCGRQP
jgi:hypothetical protein